MPTKKAAKRNSNLDNLLLLTTALLLLQFIVSSGRVIETMVTNRTVGSPTYLSAVLAVALAIYLYLNSKIKFKTIVLACVLAVTSTALLLVMFAWLGIPSA